METMNQGSLLLSNLLTVVDIKMFYHSTCKTTLGCVVLPFDLAHS